MLAFANFDKSFLLETNASKLGLGAALLQKQSDGQYLPVTYASQSLRLMKGYMSKWKKLQSMHGPLTCM